VLSRKNPPLHARDAPLQQFCGNDDSLALQRTNEARENNQTAGSVLATDHRTLWACGHHPSTARLDCNGQYNDNTIVARGARKQEGPMNTSLQGSNQGRGDTHAGSCARQGSFRICSNWQVPVVRSKRCATEVRRAVYGQESANRAHKAELCCRCRRSEAENSVQF
jgi:hypothetical protein